MLTGNRVYDIKQRRGYKNIYSDYPRRIVSRMMIIKGLLVTHQSKGITIGEWRSDK